MVVLVIEIFNDSISHLLWCLLTGDLKSTLSRHKGPIFSLKWNKKGDYLLTGSCDKTAIVWDVKAEEPKQQFEFHSGVCLLMNNCGFNPFIAISKEVSFD